MRWVQTRTRGDEKRRDKTTAAEPAEEPAEEQDESKLARAAKTRRRCRLEKRISTGSTVRTNQPSPVSESALDLVFGPWDSFQLSSDSLPGSTCSESVAPRWRGADQIGDR